MAFWKKGGLVDRKFGRGQKVEDRPQFDASGRIVLDVGWLSRIARGKADSRDATVDHLRSIATSGGKACKRARTAEQRAALQRRTRERAIAKGMPDGGWQARKAPHRYRDRIVLAFPSPTDLLSTRDVVAMSGLTKPQVSTVLYQHNLDTKLFEKIENVAWATRQIEYAEGIHGSFMPFTREPRYLWALTEKGMLEWHDLKTLVALLE